MNTKARTPDGIVPVDKPAGMTSHDVVAGLRRMLNTRRIGHGGTLDPPATGLLVLFVGRATRLVQYLGGGLKVYEARIRFGSATDTDDAAGATIARAAVPDLRAEEWIASSRRFLGDIQQQPPAVSALHSGGRRAHELVRKGERPDLAPRTVRIESIEILAWSAPDLEVRVTCRGGTYLRALARDWGAAVGSAAHVAALRRTRSGPFSIEEGLGLDELETAIEKNGTASVIRPPGPILKDVVGQATTLSDDRARGFLCGNRIPLEDGSLLSDGPVVVLAEDGELLGLAKVRRDDETHPLLAPVLVWKITEP